MQSSPINRQEYDKSWQQQQKVWNHIQVIKLSNNQILHLFFKTNFIIYAFYMHWLLICLISTQLKNYED